MISSYFQRKYRKEGIFEEFNLISIETILSYLLCISFSRELQLANLQWFRPVSKEKRKNIGRKELKII